MSKNDLAVVDSNFDEAISKFESIYSNLVDIENKFNSVSEDLLDGFEGKAAKTTKEVVSDLKIGFNIVSSDFAALSKELKASYNALHSSDQQIANSIDMSCK